MSLWRQLKEAMLQHPERQVSEGNTSLTYEEMVVWAELFASRLKGQQCCAILCSSELETAMALLGCLAAEVTAVPLSFKYGKQHYTKILRKIRPTALIISGDRQLNIISFTDSTYQAPKEHPALIMCTSGTTGEPKGAMLSEHNIRTNVEDIVSYMKTDENDRILIARPLYHCAVLTGEFLTSLFKGSDICFYSEPFHPLKLMETIREKEITVFGATPTILSVLARLAMKNGVPTLAHICVSGEIMTTAVGDAGINYYEDDRDVRLKRELANLNITLLCLHGNKEKRPEEIATYGVRSFCGGQVYYEPAYPNIFFAKDGETYVFEGKKYLAIGGAHSVDRYRCIESHLPYWENEMPDDRVKQKVDAVLKRENGCLYGFLTHTCPMKYFPREILLSLRQMNAQKPFLNQNKAVPAKLDIDRSTEEWLDCIEGRTEYSIWFCGHYHIDKQIDKLVMMYHEIRPLHMETKTEIDQ